MALTPETLTRHELNGLHVEVVDASNPDLVGIAGRVVLETMKTLQVDCGDDVAADRGSRVRQVPKEGTTFEFRLDARDSGGPRRTDEAAGGRKAPGTTSKPVSTPDNPDTVTDSVTTDRDRDEAGDGVAYVTVDGATLLSRPALRTENAGDTKW